MPATPIFLFTDFGAADLYVGQVKAALWREAAECCVIDLLNHAPSFDIGAGAHLLAALCGHLPAGAVILAVVDPGVGSARGAIALEADARWYVGPDNGLVSVVAQRAAMHRCFDLGPVPASVSASFHGRDVFAPAAARFARNTRAWEGLAPLAQLAVELDAGDLPRIIYIDHYGNAITGVRAGSVERGLMVEVAGHAIAHARVFSEVQRGELFWYANSMNLVEIASNGASAAARLGLHIGDAVSFFPRR